MASQQQRPYSTLHSPDSILGFSNPSTSQYSLHTPIDENPFYPTARTQSESRLVSSPLVGTSSSNDIPLEAQRSASYSPADYATTPVQYPTPMATPAPGYPTPTGTPAPGYPTPMGTPAPGYPTPMGTPAPGYSSPPLGFEASRSQTTSPYVPLSNLPKFPPPPTHDTAHLGPATSPPPTQHLPPIPPEPAHNPHPAVADRQEATVYTPTGGSGPSGGVHAPGQIGHPNQQHGKDEYHHGLCDCFSDIGTCCTGYFCPCILYSRTKHRIKTAPNSNLNDFTAVNPHCLAFCALSPVAWVFTMLQRTRIREKYQLQGSVTDDCCKAYCCGPCTLIQDEREVNDREDQKRRFAGPGSGGVPGGYKKQETMVYGRVDL